MVVSIQRDARLRGKVLLPASKSISNRALMMVGMHEDLEGIAQCQDTNIVAKALGHPTPTIDVESAGTAMRFLTAHLSLMDGEEHLLTGTDRMTKRPIGLLVEALRKLGADITYAGEEGFPPLKIKGRPLEGGVLYMAGDVSSQYTSALLMAAPRMEKGLTLHLTGEIASRPYIDMTLTMMRTFGIQAEWVSGHEIEVHPAPYRPVPFRIEKDWSASSYWYELMALSHDEEGCLQLPGLSSQSMQGDRVVADLFVPLGVQTEYSSDGITLRKGSCSLRRAETDFRDCPDLAQTLVVTCALLGIPFRFSGLQSLRIKETDRLSAMVREMARLGYVLSTPDDGTLCWDGTRCPAESHPVLHTYQDHRMAMSLAAASMLHGSIEIEEPEVVKKSYPRFWKDLFSVFPIR